MKNLVYLFLLTAFISCGQSVKKAEQSSENIYQVSESSIKSNLEYLSSDELKGRQFGTDGINFAAKYIEGVFKKNNVKPYFKTYRDSFQHKGKAGYNLVAFKEGTDPKLKKEIVVLGAHYDHIGIMAKNKSVKGDSIANGANDNAAGTTSVIELAKYFSGRETKRSIMFVLFSAEEEGLIGSKHLAKRLAEEKAPIYLMLNFEMIGIPLVNTSYTAYLTGFKESNMGAKFNEYAGKEVFGFFEKAKEYQLFKRSDNYPFYKEMKIPAQTLCTFDFSNYSYYHHVDDEAELMDISHMKNLIEEVIPGIEGMVNSAEKEIQLN